MFDFWQIQSDKLLFPEIAWSKPEQKSQAGKLLIIGGHANAFRSVALAYETALKTGAGQVRAVVPNSLRKLLPANILDVVFAESEQSGGFSAQAINDFKAGEAWADCILIIGDIGKNSETAITIDKFVLESEKPIIICRDAIDTIMNSALEISEKSNISLIMSLQQLQKFFRQMFYPKAITFSMQLSMLADALHKFTSVNPIQIATFHQESLIVAEHGKIFSIPQNSKMGEKISPLKIWSGQIPTQIATYQLWNPQKRAESAITSTVD